MTYLSKSQGRLYELVQGSKEGLPVERKVNHIAFTVSEIEKEIEHLKANKVNFTQKNINNLYESKHIFLGDLMVSYWNFLILYFTYILQSAVHIFTLPFLCWQNERWY